MREIDKRAEERLVQKRQLDEEQTRLKISNENKVRNELGNAQDMLDGKRRAGVNFINILPAYFSCENSFKAKL